MNPGGSVKDRAALGIVLDAERRGVPEARRDTICEATAGNTGVGLALIGVQRGYRVRLFIPEGYAEEKCVLMRGFGAEVERTPRGRDDVRRDPALRCAFERETPGAFAALQFENPANPDFHEQTTAVEMFEQMEGRIDAVVLGVGSAGRLRASAALLKRRCPIVLTVAVETEGSVLQGGARPGPHRVEGIGVSFVPATFDRSVCDAHRGAPMDASLRHGAAHGARRGRAGRVKRGRDDVLRRWQKNLAQARTVGPESAS